jgi:hypothetical protein
MVAGMIMTQVGHRGTTAQIMWISMPVGRVDTSTASRSRSLSMGHRTVVVWSSNSIARISIFILREISVFLLAIRSTASHPDITADSDPTTLVCHHATQWGAFGETREFLRAVDLEGD